MKNLFLIIATVLSFTANTFSNNVVEGALAIVKSEKVVVSVETANQKEFFLSSQFNTENDNLEMMFKSSVKNIQIYNKKGDLVILVPINANKITLGLSIFDEGQYRMGFMIEGMDEVQYTKLMVK